MKYLTVPNIAKKTGHSTHKLYRWKREGKLKKDEYKLVKKVVKQLLIREDFKR